MKIALKFCGHCRPNMDMPRIASLLNQEHPEIEFVTMLQDISDCPVLLRLNACSVGCSSIPEDYDGKVISISCAPGEDLDQVYARCLENIFPSNQLIPQ